MKNWEAGLITAGIAIFIGLAFAEMGVFSDTTKGGSKRSKGRRSSKIRKNVKSLKKK